jgi:NDP-sugar pyrophosphorylase family protein
MDVSAAILAGGLGTRLRPVVADRPKVLARVAGRPFLCYLLDQLAQAGLGEVLLLTGHLGEQVRDELGDGYGGVRLVYSREPAPLGTGGAVRAALGCLKAPAVLLLNGDSFFEVDLPAFYRFHVRRGGSGTAKPQAASIALTRVADTSRYGRVRLRPGGRVVRFEEKATGAGPGWVNAGVYLLARRVVEAIPEGRPVSLEREVLPAWVARGEVYGHRRRGRFLDIGTPESFARAEEFFGAGAAVSAGG